MSRTKKPSAYIRGAMVLLGAGLLIACGGGGGDSGNSVGSTTYSASSGVAQKGPLLQGSTVSVQELNASLSPTGRQFTYQINSDLGTFNPTSTFKSQYIGITATGYYFDEVTNAVSGGTVTLNGISDLSSGTVLNVNLLTTLAYQRIQNLVINSHMTVSVATAQAEAEVLAALNIPAGKSDSRFGSLDLSQNSDGSKALAAVSSVFVYGNTAGQLSSLIASFQSDIADNGIVDSAATKLALANASQNIDAAAVAANLNSKYAGSGVSYSAEDLSNWIDVDGSGVAGKFKYKVPNATQSTSFTFPPSLISHLVGSTISLPSLASGQLWVNGAMAASRTVQAADVIAVTPPSGTFTDGVVDVYVLRETKKVAKISFISGLQSITVTPVTSNIPAGLTQQYTATATFSDTSTSDITNNVVWSVNDDSIASVNSMTGLATAISVGHSATITATSGSVSGSATLNVSPAVLLSIAVSPDSPLTGVGVTNPLSATGIYSDGHVVNLTNSASWISDAVGIATVGANTGVVTGVAKGSTIITATSGAVSGSQSLTVVSNEWMATGGLSETRQEGFSATLLSTGKVLVAGGTGDNVNVYDSKNGAELYNPTTHQWSAAGSLVVARSYHTATLLANGKVLIVGGQGTGGSSLASAELYDPSANTWSVAASLSAARRAHAATLLANGMVLVTGGLGADNSAMHSAELYNPATNTWSAAGSLSVARSWHTQTVLANDKVLVAGGVGSSFLSSAEIYNPVTNTWSSAGALVTGRGYHTASLLANGLVLVAAGVGNAEQRLRNAEFYNPVTNTWSATGSLTTGRNFNSMTLLPNGVVLVAAGFGDAGVLSSAELYDPTLGTWSAAGSLVSKRSRQKAVLLPDGTVLAVGGMSPANIGLGSAELYLP